MTEYRDYYEWDDDEWGDDQSVISMSDFRANFLDWSLYEDDDGHWRCTCPRYKRLRRCFHTRYRKEDIIKVREEYL